MCHPYQLELKVMIFGHLQDLEKQKSSKKVRGHKDVAWKK
jgi:hypothetical protein